MKTKVDFLPLIDTVVENGFAVCDDFISPDYLAKLRHLIKEHYHEGEFKDAEIGDRFNQTKVNSIRKDEILWLSRGLFSELVNFYSEIDRLVSILNRYCFLSINDCEFHFAVYPPGAFYKKHVDQFKTNDARLLTVICYLNEFWDESYGGELMIYPESGPLRILPQPGRLVLFKSDELPHEVLITNKTRLSITGWLKHKHTPL
ncbi:2OG-Fe(II) oxygenase [Mangrovivirga cuniculi]|uniref:Oxidoreductase n=1 Tax=Mangrovivirga cuniculi TaxID=2715131 RepID=A0A4D7JTN5_9BACT|nr:2OG-Fe(II) oxygenase [Mangrovivirga cuniculi]QCK15506.1 oxidoreductase [Mangrovivirga cuniculi]